jgi:phenylpyruvate tautomerase PptA (4-oxalocrotonate tautomerase family)
MPFIQVDVREGLTHEHLAELGSRIVDVVRDAIGSAREHINVSIRQIRPVDSSRRAASPRPRRPCDSLTTV